MRQELLEIDGCLKDLLETLITLMEENLDTYMPGFTHMQKAQPTTLAHHLGAYFETVSYTHLCPGCGSAF